MSEIVSIITRGDVVAELSRLRHIVANSTNQVVIKSAIGKIQWILETYESDGRKIIIHQSQEVSNVFQEA